MCLLTAAIGNGHWTCIFFPPCLPHARVPLQPSRYKFIFVLPCHLQHPLQLPHLPSVCLGGALICGTMTGLCLPATGITKPVLAYGTACEACPEASQPRLTVTAVQLACALAMFVLYSALRKSILEGECCCVPRLAAHFWRPTMQVHNDVQGVP